MHHCASSLYTRELKVIVLYQPFQNRTIPRKSPTPLPPLSKGGGLTARHKLSLCCIFTCDTSAFFIHQTFCRQDGGIALRPPTSQSPQPSQKHINRFAPHHVLASLVKGEVLSPKKIRATTGGIATQPSLPQPHPSFSHYSSSNIHFLPVYP